MADEKWPDNDSVETFCCGMFMWYLSILRSFLTDDIFFRVFNAFEDCIAPHRDNCEDESNFKSLATMEDTYKSMCSKYLSG